MSQVNREQWKNHAHWDHGGAGAAPAPARWETPALRHFLKRHHLPAHPAGPLVLVGLGLAHCLLVIAAFRSADHLDPAALSFAAAALFGFAVAPGIGLIATGAWDLLRRPWLDRAHDHRKPS